MTYELPTVKIHDPANPADYVIINAADFREGVHQRWQEDAPQSPAETQATEAPVAPKPARRKKA